jgi:spoIIIJ-associated protein
MEQVEGKGSTEDEAVTDALAKLGAKIGDVEIEVLKKSKRFLGILGEEEVTVRVTRKESASKNELSEYGDSMAKKVLSQLLYQMGIEGEVTETLEGDSVNLSVLSNSGGLLIGRKGETLDSLEYIVNRIVNKNLEERLFITVDTENYRDKREKKLLEMALTAAKEVRKSGRPYEIANLSAKERKVIHLAIQDEEGVDTYSEGEGLDRRLIIKKN